jgi:hypothetical protein
VPEIAETSNPALPPDLRHRLEQFLQRVDRLRVEDLPMFATRPLDQAGYDESLNAATHAAFDYGRRATIDEVHREAIASLGRHIGRQIDMTAGTTMDLIRLRESLTACLTALVLWDVLDDAYRGHLIGPWAALIDEAAA